MVPFCEVPLSITGRELYQLIRQRQGAKPGCRISVLHGAAPLEAEMRSLKEQGALENFGSKLWDPYILESKWAKINMKEIWYVFKLGDELSLFWEAICFDFWNSCENTAFAPTPNKGIVLRDGKCSTIFSPPTRPSISHKIYCSSCQCVIMRWSQKTGRTGEHQDFRAAWPCPMFTFPSTSMLLGNIWKVCSWTSVRCRESRELEELRLNLGWLIWLAVWVN